MLLKRKKAPRDESFEDISSSSVPIRPELPFYKKFVSGFGDYIFKNLSEIIKGIAIAVSAAIVLIFIIIAFLLIKLDSFFVAIAIGVIIVGIIIAAITLFLIYALGHMIAQNQEILEKLK